MVINKLEIRNYKNLTLFHYNKGKEKNVVFLVGDNGSGKTNVFEALLIIFRHLLRPEFDADFLFYMKYILRGQNITVDGRDKHTYINIDDKKFTLKEYHAYLEKRTKHVSAQNYLNSDIESIEKYLDVSLLPQNIVVYSSGESRRSYELVRQVKYYDAINSFKVIDEKNYRSLILEHIINMEKRIGLLESYELDSISLYFQPKQFYKEVKERLIDKGITNQVNSFIRYINDKNHFRKKKNMIEVTLNVREFRTMLHELNIESIYNLFDYFRNNDFFSDRSRSAQSSVLLYFQRADNNSDLKHFDNERNNNVELNDLGEGEKLYIIISSCMAHFNKSDTIFLFDEPDAYLNPQNITNLVNNFTSDNHKNQFWIASHSANLLSRIKNQELLFLENGTIKTSDITGYGQNVTHILRDFMNFLPYADEIQNLKRKFYDSIHGKQLKEAEQLLKDLEEFWDEENTDYVAAKTELKLLELFKNDNNL